MFLLETEEGGAGGGEISMEIALERSDYNAA